MDSPPGSPGRDSDTSTNLTTKQYILVNLSKFVVEFVGTATLGTIYLLAGAKQAAVMLLYWVLLLFGTSISGGHYNPCVTLVVMVRKNSSFASRRLLGILFIIAQFLGGLIAAVMGRFLTNADFGDVLVTPRFDNDGTNKSFSALISEIVGTYFFVFMFMLSTDKKTMFSEDKVINCFIIASAYVSSRLIAGGSLVSGFRYYWGDSETLAGVIWMWNPTGPMLNPAFAFGQMLIYFDFTYILEYAIAPFGGAALALIFYEFIFVKTQEMLDDEDDDGTL